MDMDVQKAFWDGIEPAEGNHIRKSDLEEIFFSNEQMAMWVDGYQALRALGVRHYYASLAVWLSLSRDDRGEVRTREDFARLMGVSRSTTYQWEERKPIREWAEWLRLRRLCGHRLAEVDERTYLAAAGEDSSASDRKLYYQRSGVWEDQSRLTLVGDEEADAVQQEQRISFDLDGLPVVVLEELVAEGGERDG